MSESKIKARLATLDELLANVVPLYLAPPPTRDTLRNLLDRHGVPKFKSNPSAKRGGGHCFYSVSHTVKVLQGAV